MAYVRVRAQEDGVSALDKWRKRQYVPRVLAAVDIAGVQPGSVVMVNVCHDDWCDLLNGRGPCNCDPDVRIEDEVRA